MFCPELAYKVLRHYWGILLPDMPLLACSSFDSAALYDAISRSEPDMKPAQVMQLVGALSMIQKCGMEGLRGRIERSAGRPTWYRLKKKLEQLRITSGMKYNALQVAEQQLCAFELLRVEDYVVKDVNARKDVSWGNL